MQRSQLSTFRHSASRALGPDAKAQAEALRSACSDVGFVYIKGHGCPEDLISKTFAATKAFILPSIAKSCSRLIVVFIE